jgi:hypothetical protein
VSLPDGEDYLMRPVLAGMCRLESLLDGTLDLGDIAWANDALAIKAENERRYREAKADQAKR